MYKVTKATVIDGEGNVLGDFSYEDLEKKYAEDTLQDSLYYWAPGMREWMPLMLGIDIMCRADSFTILEGDGNMVLFGEMPEKPVSRGQPVPCVPWAAYDYDMATEMVRARVAPSAQILKFPRFSPMSEEILREDIWSENIKITGYASWFEFTNSQGRKVRDEWVVYCCEYGRKPLPVWVGSRDGSVSALGSQSIVEGARQAAERQELTAYVSQLVLKSREASNLKPLGSVPSQPKVIAADPVAVNTSTTQHKRNGWLDKAIQMFRALVRNLRGD